MLNSRSLASDGLHLIDLGGSSFPLCEFFHERALSSWSLLHRGPAFDETTDGWLHIVTREAESPEENGTIYAFSMADLALLAPRFAAVDQDGLAKQAASTGKISVAEASELIGRRVRHFSVVHEILADTVARGGTSHPHGPHSAMIASRFRFGDGRSAVAFGHEVGLARDYAGMVQKIRAEFKDTNTRIISQIVTRGGRRTTGVVVTLPSRPFARLNPAIARLQSDDTPFPVEVIQRQGTSLIHGLHAD